jgi:hypothetical protein
VEATGLWNVGLDAASIILVNGLLQLNQACRRCIIRKFVLTTRQLSSQRHSRPAPSLLLMDDGVEILVIGQVSKSPFPNSGILVVIYDGTEVVYKYSGYTSLVLSAWYVRIDKDKFGNFGYAQRDGSNSYEKCL